MTPVDYDGPDDWAKHKRLVMFRFEVIDAKLDGISKRLHTMETRVALIAGAAGLVGWAIPQILEFLARGGK